MEIKVRYSSVDGSVMNRKFKTLSGARKFATDYVGQNPEIGGTYAVSSDGIGKVQVEGVTLAELFNVSLRPGADDLGNQQRRAEVLNYTATYSPDDNKLRLYASGRLDKETFDRVKAAGFRWAPKQELFVAPAWSPGREDLLIELAGEIGDEDKSLVERTEERAERFEEYSDKRAQDAESARKAVRAIADNIPFGQPILVGHHSEKRARKDAERIENGMRKAVKMWEQSGYWADRAAGAIQAAKYKELPAVRARRIKGLESDLRKVEKSKRESEKQLKAWKMCAEIVDDPEKQRKVGLMIANGGGYWSMSFPLKDFPRDPPASQYEGPMGLWSAIDGNVITAAQAAAIAIPSLERSIPRQNRWIEHYDNRLAYERAMLAESGGTEADKTKPEVGGAVRCWVFYQGWLYIQKVNKVTVTVWNKVSYGDRVYRSNVPFDKLAAVMSKAEVNMAKQAGRVTEVGSGDKITGFVLADAEPEPTPPPAPAPKEEPTEFEAMKASLKAGVKVEAVNQLFPTPREVAEEAVALANIQPGDEVLEPSAGLGALLGAMGGKMFGHNPERGGVTAVEINPRLADRLRIEFPLTKVICGDFLEMAAGAHAFDVILMNPPFENGADIRHIQHALRFLKPGGRIVAICANGPRQQARLKPVAKSWRELEAGTFAGTGVRAALIVIEREAAILANCS